LFDMRGRKPKPTALKLLHGNPGHRPLNAHEPKPSCAVPDCPEHLDSVARMEWERIVPELESLGLVAHVYRAAIAGYCQAYSRWQAAEAEIATEGLTTMNLKTGCVRAHPAVAIAKEHMRLVKEFAVEFGLTASSMGRMKVEPKKHSVPTRIRA
jgi:P27 family predicted phage terminase small subunit